MKETEEVAVGLGRVVIKAVHQSRLTSSRSQQPVIRSEGGREWCGKLRGGDWPDCR